MAALRYERETLTGKLASCDRDAFPGSRAWARERDAIKALAAFDAAHPEVLAAINAEHSEQVAERTIPAGGR